MDELERFFKTHKLLTQLQIHIEGGARNDEIDLQLAKDLMTLFPEYKYEGYAYRTIKGDWEKGFNNVSWSEYETSSKYAFFTQYPSSHKGQMRTYMCRVTGFNVGELVNFIQSHVNFFSKGAAGHAYEEHEILAVSFDENSVEEINPERESA